MTAVDAGTRPATPAPVSAPDVAEESSAFAPGAFARLTVHHDVSTAVLRSDDFGVTHPTQVVPAPARAALALAGPPRNPASPFPASRTRLPSLTPAGMFTR